ncbi:MAG: Fe-S cluster assembly protein SufD [Rikenellaceae bacterium]|nr:Fe-S cluster assembly protein SufD [Rikenellaceae bacterium]
MPERIETRLSELYVENFERIMQGWPSYINSQRRELMESFALHCLPGSADEEYRHFDLQKLLSGVTSLSRPGPEPSGESPFYIPGNRSIVLENGRCAQEGLVRLHNGVVYGSLLMAAVQMPEVVHPYYNTSVDIADDVAAMLCGAFCQDGAFVYIPDGYGLDELIHIDIRYAADGSGEICFPRILIVAGEGASVNVAVTHSDIGFAPVTSCHVREIFAGKRAKVEVTEGVSMREDSILIQGCYSNQQEGSVSAGTALWLRAGAMRVNSLAALSGRDAQTTLYGLYFANGRQLCDINMKVKHNEPDCRSYEVIKGVVSQEATGAFTGMVYVAPDAQKTSALQQSRNLQLSNSSQIYTEPRLEIYADDVKCSHGATVGQLDDQAIYYMRQRGISEPDAKRLQLRGFVNDIISHCSAEQMCKRLSELAEERISNL